MSDLVDLLALCLDLPELILQQVPLFLLSGQLQLQLVQPAPLLLLLLLPFFLPVILAGVSILPNSVRLSIFFGFFSFCFRPERNTSPK